MKNYWDKAITFEEYIQIAKQRLETPSNQQEADYKQYYELGLQRIDRTLKKYVPDEEQLNLLNAKNFDGKILIISEAWCGDASATVPALVKFFEGRNEVKIFLRDSDTSLINQFLTDGTQSIPKVLILDNDFNVKNSWGPRPKFGKELLMKFKADPEAYPREQFYNDLQIYYAKNRGKDAIQEIVELL
ncbi:thioredoxin family protein [Chryseobacterium daecheongense]|uniref:Thioredoxin family protein n=1 Tax=Chryseobacterium daecheongense TaxID=192389 RepID=A0A3N0W6N5_9FLAO|nr:thioredoxin family protein [Chryseobacterium daecheongense]ROI00712.1 thioredoxin family protein [Chryseobacterium daecheongense]TDX94293.1 thioredoxin-like protein [Chryseobacterium daecheongense]